MITRRKGSYLTVCFEVRDNSWILEKGWIGNGATERARIKEFVDTLYANLSAQYAFEIANSGWIEFQSVVAEAVLAQLPRDDNLHFDHLSGEFWARVEMLYQASVTCSLLESFAVPYNQLQRSLLTELQEANIDDDLLWTSTAHVLLPRTSLAVRFMLPSGEVPLVFGSATQSGAVTVDWLLVLPRVTRLTYVLDESPPDVDDSTGFF